MAVPSLNLLKGVLNQPELRDPTRRAHQNTEVTAVYDNLSKRWIADKLCWNENISAFVEPFNKNERLVKELNDLINDMNEILSHSATKNVDLAKKYKIPLINADVEKNEATNNEVELASNSVRMPSGSEVNKPTKTKQKKGTSKMNIEMFIGNPKEEMAGSIWRVAAGSVVELVREPLAEAICNQMGFGKSKALRNKVSQFLMTGIGRGVVSLVLAVALPSLSMLLPEDVQEHSKRLAKEMRMHGYEHLMIPVAALLTGPIKESIIGAIRGAGISEKIRVAIAASESATAPSAAELEDDDFVGSNTVKIARESVAG